MSGKNIFIKDIGNVLFKKRKQSRNISIRLKPLAGVSVTLPYYVSYNHAIKVVEQRKPWILKNLPKIQKIEKRATSFNEFSDFKTKYRKLLIKKGQQDIIKSIITANLITIEYPFNLPVEKEEIQNVIKQTIIKALRIEAKHYLPLRTEELAQKHKFKYNKVFVKNNKTLWGSCSSVNNINLNIHLMRLPEILSDYVILHELCHTIEKNHGKHFWDLLNSITGDAKKLSKELQTYSIQIY